MMQMLDMDWRYSAVSPLQTCKQLSNQIGQTLSSSTIEKAIWSWDEEALRKSNIIRFPSIFKLQILPSF